MAPNTVLRARNGYCRIPGIPNHRLGIPEVRYSPRNIKIACDHAGLTHYGGVYFFHEFLRVLQIRNFLATHLTYPRRNSRYHLSQMILALMYPIVLGLDRLEAASFLTFQRYLPIPERPAEFPRSADLASLPAPRT